MGPHLARARVGEVWRHPCSQPPPCALYTAITSTAVVRERDESLPVILLTARGSERRAVRAIKAGAYEYVPKPFDVDEMLVTRTSLAPRESASPRPSSSA